MYPEILCFSDQHQKRVGLKDLLSLARSWRTCVCVFVCTRVRVCIHGLWVDCDSSVIKTYDGKGAGNRPGGVGGLR